MHHNINLSPMSKDFKAQVTAKSAACGQTIPEKHRSKDSSRSTHLSTMGLSEKQVPHAIHWISLESLDKFIYITILWGKWQYVAGRFLFSLFHPTKLHDVAEKKTGNLGEVGEDFWCPAAHFWLLKC